MFFYNDTVTNDVQIDYSRCIKNTVLNCYASNQLGSCKLCQKGYILNLDLQCETILGPKCISEINSSFMNDKVKYNTLNYLLYYQPQGNGCNQCINGYVGYLLTENQIVCTNSNYIKQHKKDFISTSKYINFCESYGWVLNELICFKCASGYILRLNSKQCLNSVSNCVTAANEGIDLCAVCETGYSLVNYQCLLGNIANCLSYYEDVYKG